VLSAAMRMGPPIKSALLRNGKNGRVHLHGTKDGLKKDGLPIPWISSWTASDTISTEKSDQRSGRVMSAWVCIGNAKKLNVGNLGNLVAKWGIRV